LRGINPDTALERCNIKFKRRFQSMEAQAEDMGKSLKDMTLAEMEELYAVSKQQERGE
jgi:XTP/dITP diphosphohydrolase